MASEEPLPGTKLVEMVVESVRVHMLSSRHVVILKETERDRYLPIWIGPWEASAIAMKLQGLAPDRPLTHDLFAAALEGLGARVDRVIISSLAEETFHARLLLEHDGRTIEVDARPSDSLALAVRAGGRIFVVESVLDQAALGADAGVGDEEGEISSGIALESTGEQIVDPRLDVFRDFVNSLDIDPGTGEPRTSGS
jgi:bifunctional DNase/RNase